MACFAVILFSTSSCYGVFPTPLATWARSKSPLAFLFAVVQHTSQPAPESQVGIGLRACFDPHLFNEFFDDMLFLLALPFMWYSSSFRMYANQQAPVLTCPRDAAPPAFRSMGRPTAPASTSRPTSPCPTNMHQWA
jgi:hypothetical protein